MAKAKLDPDEEPHKNVIVFETQTLAINPTMWYVTHLFILGECHEYDEV